ncbi:MAG: alpha/beta fold hydrolase [Victivallaceae bacterium]|nr:alpha/beta fold hydrolase [Victivallaceae bacterium]
MLVDMPVAQLETYQGRNPRPADFDEYWQRALDELDARPPEVTFAPARFGNSTLIETGELFFTGVGGSRIFCKMARPRRSADRTGGAVLKFHGYSGDSGDYAGLVGIAAHGLTVLAMDCRGQGGRSEDLASVKGSTFHDFILRGMDDSPDKLYFRNVFLDCAEAARILRTLPDVDGERIGVCGGSQGGGLTLACAALAPFVKCAAPIFPFLCDYQRVWEMDQAKAAYQDITYYFRHFDPLHEREKELFTRLGYIDVQHLAPRITAKVLMQTGLMDTVCPPSTQYAAYNKITAPKEHILYPDFGHEDMPCSNDRSIQFLLQNLG